MFRKIKLHLVLALVFIMSIMSIPVALADGDPATATTPAAEAAVSTSQAAINKLFMIPYGVTIPTTTFEFQVEAYSVNSDTKNFRPNPNPTGTPTYNMPIISDPAYTGNNADLEHGIGVIQIGFPSEKYTHTELIDGVNYYYLESDSLFDIEDFTDDGIYTYKIREVQNTYEIQQGTENHEKMIYSKAAYTVVLFVQYIDITVNDDLEIKFIGVTKDNEDNGDLSNDNSKIDPTPSDPDNPGGTDPGGTGDPGNSGTPDNNNNFSKMIFTNKYLKTNGAVNPNESDDPFSPGQGPDDTFDPDDPKNITIDNLLKPNVSTLEIGKKVDSHFGPISIDRYFDFTLTLKLPRLDYSDGASSAGGPPDGESYFEKSSYRAYIIQEDPDFSDTSYLVANMQDNGGDKDKNYIDFEHNEAVTFRLKHGQRLIFIDTPVGTGYILSEAGTKGFKPDANVTYNGGIANNIQGIEDEGLALPGSDTFRASQMYVGEKASSTYFNNDEFGFTPGGLNLNDLPFIGLIAIGLGALIIFVILKSRKKAQQQSQ